MDAHLRELAEKGEIYEVRRRQSTDLFRDKLIDLLGPNMFNWSSSYGRGYLYEFFIEQGASETSLIVEVSDVAQVAFVYFGYRQNIDGERYVDECRDSPRDSRHQAFRDSAVRFLQEQGYEILPHATSSIRCGGKTLRELLIDDPED